MRRLRSQISQNQPQTNLDPEQLHQLQPPPLHKTKSGSLWQNQTNYSQLLQTLLNVEKLSKQEFIAKLVGFCQQQSVMESQMQELENFIRANNQYQIRDANLDKEFVETVCAKLGECLQYLHHGKQETGLNQEQKQNQYVNNPQLLSQTSKNLRHTIASICTTLKITTVNILKQSWSIIKKTKNYNILQQYLLFIQQLLKQALTKNNQLLQKIQFNNLKDYQKSRLETWKFGQEIVCKEMMGIVESQFKQYGILCEVSSGYEEIVLQMIVLAIVKSNLKLFTEKKSQFLKLSNKLGMQIKKFLKQECSQCQKNKNDHQNCQKNKEKQKLLELMIKNSKQSVWEGKLFEQLILKGKFVTNEQQQGKNCQYQYEMLTKDIDTKQIFQKFSKNNSYRFTISLLNQTSLFLSQTKIYLKFPSKALHLLNQNNISVPTQTVMNNVRQLIIKLIENRKLPCYFLGNAVKQQQENIVRYIKGIFKVGVLLMRDAHNRQSFQPEIGLFFDEKIFGFLAEMLQEQQSVMQMKNNKQEIQQKCQDSFISDVIEYLHFRIVKQTVQHKAIVEILICLLMKKLAQDRIKVSNQWRIVYKMKKILEKWFEIVTAAFNAKNKQQKQIQQKQGQQKQKQIQEEKSEQEKHFQMASLLIRKIFTAYFDHSCNIQTFSLKFATPKLIKQYQQMYSKEILYHVEQLQKELTINSQTQSTQNSSLYPTLNQKQQHMYNIILFKLHNLLISLKFELTTCIPIAGILRKIYIQFGHLLTQVYHFRSFICYYWRSQDERKQRENLVQLVEMLGKESGLLQDQTFGNQIDELFFINSQLPHTTTFLTKLKILQNHLDLKTSTLTLPAQTYKTLILSLLAPMNTLCQNWYSKILKKMQQSVQNTNKIANTLSTNIVYKGRDRRNMSLYQQLSWIFFDLKMTLRVYLVNIEKLVSYQQCKVISYYVGFFFEGILSKNQNLVRNNVQILNDLLAGEKWKKKSRLNYSQTLYQAGLQFPQAQKFVLNNSSSSSLSPFSQSSVIMPRQIVIPLFTYLQENNLYIPIIKKFSQLAKDYRGDHYRFNHQIASQRELLSLVRHRQSFSVARRNTVCSHGKELFELFFLPNVKSRSQEEQKIKLGFYLEQIRSLLSSQDFSQHILTHIQKILKIYKTKPNLTNPTVVNNNPPPNNQNLPNIANQTENIPTTATTILSQEHQKLQQQLSYSSKQYNRNITPISHSQFRQIIGKLLYNYMQKITEEIYRTKATPQVIFTVYKSLMVIKKENVYNANNENNNNENENESKDEPKLLTSQQFAQNLLRHGQNILKNRYKQIRDKLEQKQKNSKQQLLQKQIKQKDSVLLTPIDIQSILNSLSKKSQPNMDDQYEPFNRNQTDKQKGAQTQKMKKYLDTPLYCFFAALVLVNLKDQDNVRTQVFQEKIIEQMLEYLGVAEMEVQLFQICDFIGKSLPIFVQDKNESKKQQNLELIKYYILILDILTSRTKKITSSSINLLLKIYHQLQKMSKYKQYAQHINLNQIRNTIRSIIIKVLNSSTKKTFKECTFQLFKLVVDCQKQGCEGQANFQRVCLEFKIKNYIFDRYCQSRVISTSNSVLTRKISKGISLNSNQQIFMIKQKQTVKKPQPKQIQINFENYLQTFYSQYKQNQQAFCQVTAQIFSDKKTYNKLIYTAGLDNLFRSTILGTSFINYKPSNQIHEVLSKLVTTYVNLSQLVVEKTIQLRKVYQQKQKNQNPEQKLQKFKHILSDQSSDPDINYKYFYKNLERIENVLKKFVIQYRMLIPHILGVRVQSAVFGKKIGIGVLRKDMKFVEWLVYNSLYRFTNCSTITAGTGSKLLMIFMNRNGLIVDFSRKIFYSQYVCAQVIRICFEELRFFLENNVTSQMKEIKEDCFDVRGVLYLVCNHLLIRQFNILSGCPVAGSKSLINLIQEIYMSSVEAITSTSVQEIQRTKSSQKSLQKSPQKQPEQKQAHNLVYLAKQCLFLFYKATHLQKIMKKNQVCLKSINYNVNLYNNQQILNDRLLFWDFLNNNQQFGRYREKEEHEYFREGRKWQDVFSVIYYFQQNLIKNIQKNTTKQNTEFQPSINHNQKQPQLSYQILAKAYTAPSQKQEKSSIFTLSSAYPPIQTISTQRQKHSSYIKNLKDMTNSKTKKQQQLLSNKIYLGIIQASRGISYKNLRKIWEDMNEEGRESRWIRNFNETEITINVKKFIQKLEKINQKNNPNSNLITENTQQNSQKMMQQQSETQKKLLQNQSYKKLQSMSYFQRVKFLLTANQQFFKSLPSEISWNIVMESNIWKQAKKKQERQKARFGTGRNSIPRRIRLDQQDQDDINQQQIQPETSQKNPYNLLSKLLPQQQIKISKNIIVAELKRFLYKNEETCMKNVENKKKTTRKQIFDNNIITILLQLCDGLVKEKVINTVILFSQIFKDDQQADKQVQNIEEKNLQEKMQKKQQSSQNNIKMVELNQQKTTNQSKKQQKQKEPPKQKQIEQLQLPRQKSRNKSKTNPPTKNTKKNTNISTIRKQFLKILQKILSSSSSLRNQLFDLFNLQLEQPLTLQYYSEIFSGLQLELIRKLWDEKYKEILRRPINYILDLALEYNHSLAILLLKHYHTQNQNIPTAALQKLFNLFINDSLTPSKLYQPANLQFLSKNAKLKQLFSQKYSLQAPPSYKLMGRVLRYQFGRLEFMKSFHEEALKKYIPNHTQFLCQVFRLYTERQLQQKQPIILAHKDIYTKIISILSKNRENISQNPLHKILKLPNFLDYNSKLTIFKNHQLFKFNNNNNPQVFDDEDPFNQVLRVDPSDVFNSSYNQIMSMSGQKTKAVRIDYMLLPDGGGIGYFRIWLQDLFQYFCKNGVLIERIEGEEKNGETLFVPNTKLKYKNQDHLNIYFFLGRILAFSVTKQQAFPCIFPNIFHKTLLSLEVTYEDLKQLYPTQYSIINGIYKTLQQKPGYNISELQSQIKFNYEHTQKNGDGKVIKQVKELKQNGNNILVTNENFQQYVKLIVKKLLVQEFRKQYQKIKEGFNSIIPLQTLQLFTEKDLELLISGVPIINQEQFKKQVKYQDYHQNDNVIIWFWEIFNQSSNLQRAKIVKYIRGSSRLSFKNDRTDKIFRIAKGPSDDKRLPHSATCGSVITLPNYSSKQILKSALNTAGIAEQRY